MTKNATYKIEFSHWEQTATCGESGRKLDPEDRVGDVGDVFDDIQGYDCHYYLDDYGDGMEGPFSTRRSAERYLTENVKGADTNGIIAHFSVEEIN